MPTNKSTFVYNQDMALFVMLTQKLSDQLSWELRSSHERVTIANTQKAPPHHHQPSHSIDRPIIKEIPQPDKMSDIIPRQVNNPRQSCVCGIRDDL